MKVGLAKLRDRRVGIDLLVWGGLAALPLFAGAWQVGQIAQYLTSGIFAMSLCCPSARRSSSASAPMPCRSRPSA